MDIRINRNPTKPPKRDYSKRDTAEGTEERLKAIQALLSLDLGHSIEFTGEEATRDRVNSLVTTLGRRGNRYVFCTAKIPNGIGVWRTA